MVECHDNCRNGLLHYSLAMRCRICEHPDRKRIELMLANGVASRVTAGRFEVQRDAVWRHGRNHMTAELKAKLKVRGFTDPAVDLKALRRAESESLLSNLIAERARQARLADKAEEAGDTPGATKASMAVVHTLGTIGKLLGELRTGGTTITQNILVNPDWHAIRRVLVDTLRPYPEAARNVARALQAFEASRVPVIEGEAVTALPAPHAAASANLMPQV